MKVACLQTDIVWENKKENFAQVEILIQKAVKQGCEVVCLPELFAIGFTMNSIPFAETIPGMTSEFLVSHAKKNGINIIGGLIKNDQPKPKNICIVIDRKGRVIGKYSKIHLFSLDKENEHYSEGDSLSFFTLDGFPSAAFICYDLRFPELFNIAVHGGAKVIFVIANWPSSRKNHWQTLLKARAIENQVYIVGVNRKGHSPFHYYSGDSLIIDPFGDTIAEGQNGAEIVIGEISQEKINQVRKKYPFLADRKPALYDALKKKAMPRRCVENL